MYRGYVAIWRKIQEHPFYKERRVFSKFEAWVDILMEAQHSKESKEVMLGMTILKCNYGECLKSKRTWAKRWGWSESKVRRYFKTLSKLNQITEKSEGSTTRLTILNYKQYDPKATHEPTQTRRTPDARAVTDKNDKNVKKETPTVEFEEFWNLYDKKTCDKKKTFSRWKKLTEKEKKLIFETLPAYIKSTPVKQYRKNPLTYLNSSGWEHEIIGGIEPETKKVTFYGGIDD